MTGKTVHFLLVYDHARHVLTSTRQFANGDEAAVAYSSLEKAHAADDDLEIVLVGADSIETIRRTHASYFEATDGYSELLIGS